MTAEGSTHGHTEGAARSCSLLQREQLEAAPSYRGSSSKRFELLLHGYNLSYKRGSAKGREESLQKDPLSAYYTSAFEAAICSN